MGWEKAGSSEVSGTWETSGWETSPIKEEKHFGDGILGYIREYVDTSDGELRYGWLVTEFGPPFQKTSAHTFQKKKPERMSKKAPSVHCVTEEKRGKPTKGRRLSGSPPTSRPLSTRGRQ